MPVVWFGADHTGNNVDTMSESWISVTLPRPVARQAINGQRPFTVAEMSWKCAAAPSSKQVMYARISNADGSVYDNSYVGNQISWEKQANVQYVFNSMDLHFADDGGTKIRCWLVSSGPFLWARNTGATGSIQSPAGNYNGTPVGWYRYVEVALPPQNLQATRNAVDSNRIDVSWKEWDPKKEDDADYVAVGGTYSLSGYYVQIARDAAFTDKVQYRAVSKGKAELYGFYAGYDWYIRIATRNQVSEHYNLYGGQWGDAVKVPLTETVDPTIDPSKGLPDGAAGGDADNDTDVPGGLAGNNGGSTSGQDGSAPVVPGQADLVKVIARVATLRGDLATVDTALQAALQEPTSTTWKNARTALNAVRNDINYIIARSADPGAVTWLTLWQAAFALYQPAYNAATAAAAAAAATLTAAQNYAAAIALSKATFVTLTSGLAAAAKNPTTKTWDGVADRLSDMRKACAKASSALVGTGADITAERNRWDAAASACQAAQDLADAASASATPGRSAAAQAGAASARVSVATAISGASTPSGGQLDIASAAIVAFTGAAQAAIAATPVSAVADSNGTIPIPTGNGGGGGGGGASVVYTPIPDTSYLRQQQGGLLLSKTGRTPAPEHTVYLMDRGGRTRLGQLTDLTRIRYNRIRDDQSEADLVINGSGIAKNKALLDSLAVGRHELCIFRGQERVWEGPITLATWQRDQVELQAKDITHYLNRTVIRGAYSNAYPNMDFVVDRIAGILANELRRKESINPPVNILPHVRTYVQEGDAQTTRSTDAATMTVWQHLDDLAAKSGIDYTVVGRALLIWDTSRPALGFTRTVTEQDFLGDTYISAYGMETATVTYVSDGQGRYGMAGAIDDYYGEIELIATAYDEGGNTVDDTNTTTTDDSTNVSQDELNEQAARNLKGRNPTPYGLHVPDGSSFDINSGLGLDNLVPGVYVPVVATLSGRTISQMLKLKEIAIEVTDKGESATITLTPASATGDTLGEGSDTDE